MSDYMVRLHGNVLFQCQPYAGNRNNPSHNNDTLTRWLIRCRLDELSLGNVCVFMWQRGREGRERQIRQKKESRNRDRTSEDEVKGVMLERM